MTDHLSETISFFPNIPPIFTDDIRLILAILVAVISGFLAHFTAVRKVRKDLEAEFDKDLRTKRIEAYPKLWRHLKIITHNEIIYFQNVNNRDLIRLYRNLHRWYFESGMFLSISSRKQFDNLKHNMRDYLKKKNLIDYLKKEEFDYLDEELDTPLLYDRSIEKMIKIGINFRNSLANDIGGRREFWSKGFRWK